MSTESGKTENESSFRIEDPNDSAAILLSKMDKSGTFDKFKGDDAAAEKPVIKEGEEEDRKAQEHQEEIENRVKELAEVPIDELTDDQKRFLKDNGVKLDEGEGDEM